MPGPEAQIEQDLIAKLRELKYIHRDDITDRAGLERNFRAKFEELNRVQLAGAEFQRLLEKIVNPDVFAAAKSLRERETIERDDVTPLNYTLVNIRDWCKNSFEIVNQLRINTDNSHHRYGPCQSKCTIWRNGHDRVGQDNAQTQEASQPVPLFQLLA